MGLDSPFSRAKPVIESCGESEFERMPGHTVWSHLFTIVNVVDNTPVIVQYDNQLSETPKRKRFAENVVVLRTRIFT